MQSAVDDTSPKTKSNSDSNDDSQQQGQPQQPENKTIELSVLLAKPFNPEKTDPTGYWLSEKKDGVRVYWNGEAFYSRVGNRFHVPEYFKQCFPKDCHLDGEFFTKRNDFANIVSIVRSFDGDDVGVNSEAKAKWDSVKFCAFDIPSMTNDMFEIRYDALQTLAQKLDPNRFQIVDQVLCTGMTHLQEFMKQITDSGGEGVMLRKAGSLYERKRSSTLLKLKDFYEMDVLVMKHETGKGKHKGVLGALWVQTFDGINFKVGTGLSDEERKSPPAIHSVINVKYTEIIRKSGKPRFPVFNGIRIDILPWDPVAVLTDEEKEKGLAKADRPNHTKKDENVNKDKPTTKKRKKPQATKTADNKKTKTAF